MRGDVRCARDERPSVRRFRDGLGDRRAAPARPPRAHRRQPFAILWLLASRAGEVVGRDELRQEIWGADTFVEFDRSLNFCIATIRATLNDDARSPRFIETLPRRGYRFLADVVTGDVQVPKSRWALVRRWAWAAALPLLVAQSPAIHTAHTRATANGDARAAFERGLAASGDGSLGLRRSVHAFREATRLDPQFAEAQYALADVYLNLASRRELPVLAALEQADAAARRAVALQEMPESRDLLGHIRLLKDGDWKGARREFERATALAPDWDGGWVSYARFLSAAGDDAGALRSIKRAETLSPSCAIILLDSSLIYARARHYDEALKKLEKAAAIDAPSNMSAGEWRQTLAFERLVIHVVEQHWADAHNDALELMAIHGAPDEQRRRFAAAEPRAAVLRFLQRSAEQSESMPPTRVALLHALAETAAMRSIGSSAPSPKAIRNSCTRSASLRSTQSRATRASRLSDFRVDRDLHRRAIDVRDGTPPFGLFRGLSELRRIHPLQPVRDDCELRRDDLDPASPLSAVTVAVTRVRSADALFLPSVPLSAIA